MEGPTKSKKRKTALQQTSLKAAFDPRERVEAAKKLYFPKPKTIDNFTERRLSYTKRIKKSIRRNEHRN